MPKLSAMDIVRTQSIYSSALAEAIEQLLTDSSVQIEQVHHGDGIVSWAVNRRAVACSHGIRTGLEDTSIRLDGRIASGIGEILAAAAALLNW